jgi:hypothetical protein
MNHRHSASVAVAVVLLVLAGGSAKSGTSSESKEAPAEKAGQPATRAPDPPVQKTYIKVGAGRLIQDYEGNEIRGDNAWKDKDVEVTGTVRSIDKGPLGGLYVVIGEPGQRVSFHNVHVNLKESEMARAAALNKGETATFRGRVQGYVIGSVSIRDAELE